MMAYVAPDGYLQKVLSTIHLPTQTSHKGQNGRLLIIGGSSLFHAAVLWSAQIASHFVDLVHFSSTIENEKIFINLKSKFTNGIVIHKKDLLDYVAEDDCILIGPGMLRGEITPHSDIKTFNDVLNVDHEPSFTYHLTEYLLEHFHEKRFVLDAGAMQMMRLEWLKDLKQPPILTPHLKEFSMVFGIDMTEKSLAEKKEIVLETAKKHRCILLLKAGITDIVSNGQDIIVIEGGTPGLTKGGTGDVLAGLTAALYAKSDPLTSATVASFLVKQSAEELSQHKGHWFNTEELISHIPHTTTNYLLGPEKGKS